MKTLILAFTLAFGTLSGFGQGFLQWGNQLTGFRALIFNMQTDNDTLSLYGQSGGFYGGTTSAAQDTPIGTVTYTGLLLSGTRYSFGVFAGPVGISSNNLQLVAQTTFATTTLPGNTLPKGTVAGGTATVPGVEAGQFAQYQIRVWDNGNGILTSWALAESAWLTGGTKAAITPVLTTSTVLGGTDPGGNLFPINPKTDGFLSFNIYYTPEPGILAIAGCGAAIMLLLRRRFR